MSRSPSISRSVFVCRSSAGGGWRPLPPHHLHYFFGCIQTKSELLRRFIVCTLVDHTRYAAGAKKWKAANVTHSSSCVCDEGHVMVD
eukprot:scaffold4049_cov204-Alexandrium_tamarense.AAC.11